MQTNVKLKLIERNRSVFFDGYFNFLRNETEMVFKADLWDLEDCCKD